MAADLPPRLQRAGRLGVARRGRIDARRGEGEGTVEPLRLGVVGCGFVTADRHLPALAHVPEVAVVALADLDTARRDRVGDRWGIGRRFATVAELLEGSDVDAIAVCTVASSHAEVARAALEAEKHVYVEKPLTLSLAEADALVETARTSACATMVGFNLRRHRLVERALHAIRGGTVGTVTAVGSTYTDPLERPDGLPAWRTRRADGGGALLEKLVHHVDLWHAFVADEVEEVVALSRHTNGDDEVVAVTGRMLGGAVLQALGADVTAQSNELVVFGDRGAIRLDLYRFDGFELVGVGDLPGAPRRRARGLAATVRQFPAGFRAARHGGLFGATYAAQWRAFAAAARDRGPATPSLEDGRRALRVVLAAAESSSAGRPVRVADAPSALAPAVLPPAREVPA